MRRALVAMAVALTACGGGDTTKAPAAPSHTLGGSLVLHQVDPTRRAAGLPCAGTGGYSDLSTGAQITVKDEAGTIVAIGTLGQGTTVPADLPIFGGVYCRWDLTAGPIGERPFYTVEVAHRGPLSYSLDDLRAKDWKVDLTLG